MEAVGSSLYRFGQGPQWTTRAVQILEPQTPQGRRRGIESCGSSKHLHIMASSTPCSCRAGLERSHFRIRDHSWIELNMCGDVGHDFGPAGMQICKMALKDLIYCDYCATSLHWKKEGQIVQSCSFVLQSCNRKSLRHRRNKNDAVAITPCLGLWRH